VHLVCDARLRLEDFASAIVQHVGEPLEPSRVAQSLKNLYATGRFSELRAEAQPEGSGVELVFSGSAQYFVGVVRVEGDSGTVEPRALTTASRLRLGQPLWEDDLVKAKDGILALLAENGYYRPAVTAQVSRDPDTQEANVIFAVSAGSYARVSSVEFQGNPLFPALRLGSVTGWRPGVRLTGVRLERGLFRLRQFYAKQGRLQTSASVQKRLYDPKTNTEKLVVQVEAGPLIRVRVQGAHVSASKLRDLLPVFRDGIVDQTALARSERILEDHFQRRGYLSASVKVEKKATENGQRIDLAYQASLGRAEEFAGYEFMGNRAVSTAELEAAITPPTTGLFKPPPSYSQELVDRYVQTLTRLYTARGFLNVRISAPVNKRVENQAGRWGVTFEISEGPQTRVRMMRLQGLGAGLEKELWPQLVSKPAQPYSPQRAESDRGYIVDFLADRGYSQATISWQATPLASEHEVDLDYRIDRGPQDRIRRVVLLGEQHTRPGIIRHELVFHEGQPLSQADLLESQRHLYDLGVFNQVQMAAQEPAVPETEKTLLVDVEETRRWTVGYGGGVEVQRLGSNKPQGQFKASPRLSLDVTRLNVGGRAQTISLRGRLSNLETGGGLSYLLPRLLTRRDLNLRVNLLADRSRDVLTFTADRKEASVSVEKLFSPKTLIQFNYSFRRTSVLDISNRISEQEIPLLSRPARVGMMGLSYANDHRDDPVDATEGSYSLADMGVSWSGFGSEADFFRFSGQNATYYRLGSHLIFARNTRLGVESPYGGLREIVVPRAGQPPLILFTHDIPLPERFFMGGSESHRGFSINQAGPRDPTTGFPLGGNTLFFNSLELRIPLAQRRLGFVLFHDAGNVYSSIRTMRLLKVTQSSPTDFDFTSHAVGMGIRYKTPVGPVRFDVGYNLNPPRFQVTTVTNNIPNTEVRRLSQYQFFLSVGQSF